MSNEEFESLAGEVISHFSLVKYLSFGIERVIVHLAADMAISLHTREVRLGADETYTLKGMVTAKEEGSERIEAGWQVGEVRVVKRQDWIESGSGKIDSVGQNPRTLTWGKLGEAPGTAKYSQVVDFGVVISSQDNQYQAMAYLADYPGLVWFASLLTRERLRRSATRTPLPFLTRRRRRRFDEDDSTHTSTMTR